MPPPVAITALGPIACSASGFTQRGSVSVTLIVKATFALVHAGAAEIVDPEPVNAAEVHHKNNPTRSIRATSDLAPYLRRADVLFVGHAYAPAGAPSARVPVRLMILRDAKTLLDKSLTIEGDAGPGGPRPFDRMPIVYERAFGGAGFAENPLGVGANNAADRPNVIDPRGGTPAGFGPISRSWPARKRLLGGADKKRVDLPIAELPDVFDWAYFQSAPADQQTEFLRGDERIVLEGMHPTLARFEARLPGARAAARVFGLPGSTGARAVGFQLDTLAIDGDALRCSAVWRATVSVPDRAAIASLRVVAALEEPGATIAWPATAEGLDAPAGSGREDRGSIETNNTLALGDDDLVEASLPKLGETMAFDTGKPEKTAPLDVGRMMESPFERTRTLSDDEEAHAARKPAAPFAGSALARSGPRSLRAPIPGAPWSPLTAQRATPPRTGSPGTLDDEEVRALSSRLEMNDAVGERRAPPPLASRPNAEALRARDPAEVGLEECAAIAAEIAIERGPREAVLRAHGLDDVGWLRAAKRHDDDMARDIDAGERSPKNVYDAAFVDAVEGARGPLTGEEHARLLHAIERGQLAQTLTALRLTRPTWLRIQRVLKRRVVHDPAYRAATDAALAKLRQG